MANRYWVGGSGTWNTSATTNWSSTSGGTGGVSAPTATDDVIFDSNSGGSTFTVTLGSNVTVASLSSGDPSGTRTLALAGFNLSTAGNGTSSTGGMDLSYFANLTTTADCTLEFRGIFRSPYLDCNYLTGAFAISLKYSSSSTTGYTGQILNNDLDNFPNVIMNCYAGSAAVPGRCSIGAGDTINIDRLEIIGTCQVLLNTDLGGTTVDTLVLGANSATYIGPADDNQDGGNSFTNTTIIDNGAVALLFRGIGFSRAIGPSAIYGNCGGTSNITYPAAKTLYARPPSGGKWYQTTSWSSSSSSTVRNGVPLPQDTAIFDGSSNGTVNFEADLGRFGSTTINSGYTGRIVPITVYAQLTLVYYGGDANFSSRVQAANLVVTPAVAGSYTFGATYTFTKLNFECYTGSTTYTLSSNISSTQLFVFGTTSLNLSAFLVAVTSFSSAPMNAANSLNLGSATVSLTGASPSWSINPSATFSSGTSTISFAPSSGTASFAGGGKSYYILQHSDTVGTLPLNITGSNTFHQISSNTGGAIRFTAATTTTVASWLASGVSAVKRLTIGSITNATHNLVYSGTGVVSANFLDISYSAASPANTWYAGSQSVDSGNNTGWLFQDSGATSNALFFSGDF